MRAGQRAAMVAVGVVLAGCFTVAPAAAQQQPGQLQTAELVTALQPEDFDADYATALQVVNGFWSAHYGEFFAGSYAPPGLVTATSIGVDGLYDGNVDRIPCGASMFQAGNAHYCGPPYAAGSHFVGFDVGFLRRAHELGDMFIYMIVAHEWGHAIQSGLVAGGLGVQYELQADCLAGAALEGAVRDGALVLEPGDYEEVDAGLAAIADAYPWGSVADHGNAQERIAMFRGGAQNGVRSCIPQS